MYIAIADSTSPYTETNLLNIIHQKLSYSLLSTAERLDYFFSRDNIDEENNLTRAHTSAGVKLDKINKTTMLSDVKLRMVLPGLRNKLHIIFDNDIENEDPSSIASINKSIQNSNPDTGLRYIILSDLRKRIQTDAGVRSSNGYQIFGRLRGGIIFPYKKWELRLNQTVMWLTKDGWEETTQMRWDYNMQNNYLFRSDSQLKWQESVKGVTPFQSFSLLKEINRKNAWHFDVSGKWPEFPYTQEAEYVTALTHRRLIYCDWLFAEISSGVSFSQNINYTPNPFVMFKMEIVFGNYPKK